VHPDRGRSPLLDRRGYQPGLVREVHPRDARAGTGESLVPPEGPQSDQALLRSRARDPDAQHRHPTGPGTSATAGSSPRASSAASSNATGDGGHDGLEGERFTPAAKDSGRPRSFS
jgi:hypothetical protein